MSSSRNDWRDSALCCCRATRAAGTPSSAAPYPMLLLVQVMLLSCRAANKSSSTWPVQSPAYCCHMRCSWTCLEQPVCSQEPAMRQAGVTHDCCARRRKLTPLQQHYCFKMLPSPLHTSTVLRMLRFFTMSKNTFMRRCIEVSERVGASSQQTTLKIWSLGLVADEPCGC
jgi:hypothetical protein